MSNPNQVVASNGTPPVATAPQSQQPMQDMGYNPKLPLISQMIFNPPLRDAVNPIIADLASMPTNPQHARNNRGMMFWVVEQHLKTGLSPMFLINGLFDPGGGKLGMTAELMLGILLASKAVKTTPIYQEVGDWSKVQGKFTEVTSQKGGKFAKPSYQSSDEVGLGIRITIHWHDEPEPITYPLVGDGDENSSDCFWMADCYPRFSTMWATDPRQQTKNTSLRKVVRRNRPDLLGGMAVDEDAYEQKHFGPARAKDITPEEQLTQLATEHVSKTSKNEDDKKKASKKAGPAVTLWLNATETSFEVPQADVDRVIRRALQKATSYDHAKNLWEKNNTPLSKLDEGVFNELGLYVEKRMGELEEPGDSADPPKDGQLI